MHRFPLVAAFDLVVCMALMFVILALTSSQTKPHIPTFGQFAIVTTWAKNSNSDVDIYVRDPQGNICFFANSNIGGMHLEHDDLGTQLSGTVTLPDGRKVVSPYNGERTVINTITPGEYTINVHLFRQSGKQPVPVTVQFWRLQGDDKLLFTRNVVILHEGDQKTVWRITLDAQGHVKSVNTRPVDLVYRVQFPATSVAPSGAGSVGFP